MSEIELNDYIYMWLLEILSKKITRLRMNILNQSVHYFYLFGFSGLIVCDWRAK